jgi:hypothetical protein
MKNPNAKLAIGLSLVTLGFLLVSFGNQWMFFLGLAFVFLSNLFSFHKRRSYHGIFGWLLSIAAILFLMWLTSYGTKRLPFAAQAGPWFAIATLELRAWRSSRRTASNPASA